MDQAQKEARNALEREPGQGNLANHGNPTVARGTAKSKRSGPAYTITPTNGEAFPAIITGRPQWALERLRTAGAKGCTPITEPAPRWSAYVFKLREMGIEIETIHEPHDGLYSGHHARYVLRSRVTAEGGAI